MSIEGPVGSSARRPGPRRWLGLVLAVVGPTVVAVTLAALVPALSFPSALLVELLVVAGVAAIGGVGAAVLAAVTGTVAANWFLAEPRHTLSVTDPDQVTELLVFLAVAALVGVLVERVGRGVAATARARSRTEVLVGAADAVARADDPVDVLLRQLRDALDQDAATVLVSDGPHWRVDRVDGVVAAVSPDDGEAAAIGDGAIVVVAPGELDHDDRRVLEAFAGSLAVARDRQVLRQAATETEARQRADELRTAILRAVSHDLRSPLASITAAATSLLQQDVSWTDDQRRDFAETIAEEADRLDRLVGNLLAMSRIEAQAVDVAWRGVGLEEVVAAALASLSEPTDRVEVRVRAELPDVRADPALLERAVANLVSNALRHSSASAPVEIGAAVRSSDVELSIVDHGAGVPAAERERLFEPFQRHGDRTGAAGVGLGLAVARGFVEAMGGTVRLEDAPTGGLAAVVSLPMAGARRPERRQGART